MMQSMVAILILFLSTLSLRRATHWPCVFVVGRSISIHALLAESDCVVSGQVGGDIYFYPRSPCGERRWLRCWQLAARDISIHALLAESDRGHLPPPGYFIISIHALLAESDILGYKIMEAVEYFYPRSPCGERLFFVGDVLCTNPISIHALLAESDSQCRTFASGM